MNTAKRIIWVLSVVGILPNTGLSQKSFGVRIGGPTQSYYVGVLNFGSVTSHVGLDYYGGSFEIDMSYQYEENNYGSHYIDNEEFTSNGFYRLFMPRVGVRYFRSAKESLKSYLLLETFIVLPSVDFESDYNGEVYRLKDRDRNRIKDALDFMAMTIGIGTEYYFSTQFSLGGEMGINILLWDWTDKDSETYYGSANYDWNKQYDYEAKANLLGSFSRMSLNFYF